jgi:hypothetical protein
VFTLILACASPPPGPDGAATSPADATAPAVDTGPVTTPVPPGTTADTGSPVAVDFPPVQPPPVDCATLLPMGPVSLASAGDPRPFDSRADGLSWFADGAIYEGTDTATAVLVYDLGGDLVREDPYGDLYWTAPPDVWRVPSGGAPEVHASGLVGFPRVQLDLEVHPHGSLILPEFEVQTGASFVSYVDPTGAITTTETTALPTPLEVRDVAWAADWRTLWVAAPFALYAVPVDGDGAPDWTQAAFVAALPTAPQQADDLTVDACGGVYLLTKVPFFPGSVTRYDPVTGTFAALGGAVDHGYGRAPLRFGRAPGFETALGTMSGGWSYLRHEWLLWDVGVGAPQWP